VLAPVSCDLIVQQTAGLGGMKPNTLALGFYSRDLPIDTFENLHTKLRKRHKAVRYLLKDQSLEKFDMLDKKLPRLETTVRCGVYMYMYMCCFETCCHKKSQLAYELYVAQVCMSYLSQITPTSYGSFVSFTFIHLLRQKKGTWMRKTMLA